ncbi:hypothetical protein K431DRAFT_151585 [Polychaeton citri CBS 116435]|uniref:Uncharacterized protein n=1 Tax=Polychaeton citri CBS 116435 TaxID=1314669 RepID=A0A9P4UKL8_9PEZI|nr:hypothetical protein K431DRAFT_151585 [Polychaeton citri CBS 116435]
MVGSLRVRLSSKHPSSIFCCHAPPCVSTEHPSRTFLEHRWRDAAYGIQCSLFVRTNSLCRGMICTGMLPILLAQY